MNDLDRRIDALYQLPLGEFTASRNAFAKTLTGEPAKQVRALKKPTVVPWAVNQLFGRARPIYDRVLETGQALRAAQLAALKGLKESKRSKSGKPNDVFAATEAHRRAIIEAVHRTTQLSATAGDEARCRTARPDVRGPLHRGEPSVNSGTTDRRPSAGGI